MPDAIPIPVDRYQPGGDIYAKLVAQYGVTSANNIAAAAETNDGVQLSNAIALARGDGPVLDDSTGSIFVNQILTDPLAAPLGVANTALGNTALSFLKSPFVLGAIGIAAFFALGGADVLRKYVKKL